MKYSTQEKYIKAIQFAAKKHGNQRTPTGLPYVTHISMVAMEVMVAHQNTNDFDLDLAITVALLHDVIEDTHISYQEIAATFNQKVADCVVSLTKDQNLVKSEQMEDSLSRILRTYKEAAIVKLADRITNLQPPPNNWEVKKNRNYFKQAQTIAVKLRGINSYLDSRMEFMLTEYMLNMNSKVESYGQSYWPHELTFDYALEQSELIEADDSLSEEEKKMKIDKLFNVLNSDDIYERRAEIIRNKMKNDDNSLLSE